MLDQYSKRYELQKFKLNLNQNFEMKRIYLNPAGIGPKELHGPALIGKVGLLGPVNGRTRPGYTVAKAGPAQHSHMAWLATGDGPIGRDTRARSEWHSACSGVVHKLGAHGSEPVVT
jgi:hypothetical protein